MIVTVTLNAALDRTLTVPNFQRGQRHRASGGLTLAGGKGINVARALKRLEVPVVATGLAGGLTGTRLVEQLTEEAILNDFVRIADESRTSTAVVDPTSSVEAAPAATADRSASSIGLPASRAARKADRSTSPDPTVEAGSTSGATARSRLTSRSSRSSAKQPDSCVISTLRAPSSAMSSSA